MKKSISLLVGLSMAIISQIASAESAVICENSDNYVNGYFENGGIKKAVEKLNQTLKSLGDKNVSQVSAPSFAVTPANDSRGNPSLPTVTACITITK